MQPPLLLRPNDFIFILSNCSKQSNRQLPPEFASIFQWQLLTAELWCRQADNKRQGLEVVLRIYNAVERLQNMKFPGMASDVDEKGRTAEEKAEKGVRRF